MNAPGFELLLFSVDAEFIRKAVGAGVAGIIVDWECASKRERQAGADTEINRHTVADLHRVRRATDTRVICGSMGPTRARRRRSSRQSMPVPTNCSFRWSGARAT